jgi:hypothetical protein
MAVAVDESVEAGLASQAVKRVALYNLTAGVGQEAFAAALEMVIKDVADNGLQNSIAQILKPFVVLVGAALAVERSRFVLKRQLVEVDAMGVEA